MPGLISRDHSTPVLPATQERPFPVLSLVGGKWTTFRAFAAEVSDQILIALERPRANSTETLPIGGGRGFPVSLTAREKWVDDIESSSGLQRSRVEMLLGRYGTRAADIAVHEGQQDTSVIHGAPDYTEAEIEWLAQNESVIHLEDLVLRRTLLAISGRLTLEGLNQVAETTGAALGWDAQRKHAERGQLLHRLADSHGVTSLR
ncbi:hypothetical protein SPICUR_04355 [Spiribacter curvatus]|uniref:Alpha-glycerophosphate oxidase C-terminal domain-containing protein n=1 Tax=Spiribacter curvatus TaxID=1335757 RepID=U5T3J8_9GAMM|nr:glycerol-3-phosphate dehydrogenase C-terminal domain-containing protein [Spiribacter curvatus]AGY91851.1 hypothetical protein SPICUR_04355 [Spiribacter curvatus]